MTAVVVERGGERIGERVGIVPDTLRGSDEAGQGRRRAGHRRALKTSKEHFPDLAMKV